MAQSVSQKFLNAQAADVNQVASKVQLVLGNYFNSAAYGTTITSNGDDGSGNFPASGAIDGDRTEINIGAAAGADNNVGKSSWKSSVIPNAEGTSATLTITMSQPRTINRIKLYSLASNIVSAFYMSYWNGTAWVVFVGTPGITGIFPPTVVTANPLCVMDFPDITTTQIMLTVWDVEIGGQAANVVEIEAYRLIDITSRVKAIKQTRQRDYKLVNPMAAQMEIDCINTDRFFSVSHVPTTSEIAAGFVNQELQPGVGVVVQMGFMYFRRLPNL